MLNAMDNQSANEGKVTYYPGIQKAVMHPTGYRTHCCRYVGLKIYHDAQRYITIPLTVKLLVGSLNSESSGLTLNPRNTPLSQSMKYRGRQFLMCSPVFKN